jgi:hypothetical protein
MSSITLQTTKEVALLTEEQKNSLIGNEWEEERIFNPYQDPNGNWVLNLEEVDGCMNPYFNWVRTLPLIEINHGIQI